MSSFKRIYVFIHDGFYCAHTGAGVHNFRLIRQLRTTYPDAKITICPVYTAPSNPDLQPEWHQQALNVVRRDNFRVMPVQNGSNGAERYGSIDHWKAQAKYAATKIIAPSLEASESTLCISVDTSFIDLIRLLPAVPHLTHLHVSQSTGLLHSPNDEPRLELERRNFQNIPPNTAIGATGDFMRRHLITAYGVDPRKLIDARNSCISEDYKPLDAAIVQAESYRWNMQDPRYVIAAYGRSIDYKGFHILVAAMRALDPKRYRLLINAATDNEQSQAYAARLKALAATHQIDLTLHDTFDINFPTFIRHHRKTRAIVVPSLSEPFGLIPSESMYDPNTHAFIIASRTGGLTEQVVDGKTGFLFDVGSVPALEAVLRRVSELTDHDATAIVARAHSYGITHFDLATNFANTAKALDQLTDRNYRQLVSG